MSNDPFLADLEDAQIVETCKICALLREMPKERRDALEAALKSKLGAETLRRILRRHGYDIGRPSILFHRREGHAA